MTRFLHTADLHLNGQRKRFPRSYLRRSRWVLQQIEQTALDHECDCIVIAGDLYDRTDLTIAERQLLSDWLGQLQVPILAISGNHDDRGERIGNTCLSYLSSLPLQRHLIHDSDPRIVGAFGAAWLLMPFHGWTRWEFDLLVRSMVWRVRRKHPDKPIVVVAHEALHGCTTDRGLEVPGSEIRISADMGVTYWALGHIHKPQQMLDSAFYCGAPHQTNYGEFADGKGVLIVDLDDPEDPELVELDSPYPLVLLDKFPEEWPEFGKYTAALKDGEKLPDHIVYAPPQAERTEISMDRAQVPLFYGLRQKLIEQQLPEELLESTIQLAGEIADELGFSAG